MVWGWVYCFCFRKVDHSWFNRLNFSTFCCFEGDLMKDWNKMVVEVLVCSWRNQGLHKIRFKGFFFRVTFSYLKSIVWPVRIPSSSWLNDYWSDWSGSYSCFIFNLGMNEVVRLEFAYGFGSVWNLVSNGFSKLLSGV